MQLVVTPSDVKYAGGGNTPTMFTHTSTTSLIKYGLAAVKDSSHIAGIVWLEKGCVIKGVEIYNGDGAYMNIFDITATEAGWYYYFWTYTGTGYRNRIITASKSLPASYKWTVIDDSFNMDAFSGGK